MEEALPRRYHVTVRTIFPVLVAEEVMYNIAEVGDLHDHILRMGLYSLDRPRETTWSRVNAGELKAGNELKIDVGEMLEHDDSFLRVEIWHMLGDEHEIFVAGVNGRIILGAEAKAQLRHLRNAAGDLIADVQFWIDSEVVMKAAKEAKEEETVENVPTEQESNAELVEKSEAIEHESITTTKEQEQSMNSERESSPVNDKNENDNQNEGVQSVYVQENDYEKPPTDEVEDEPQHTLIPAPILEPEDVNKGHSVCDNPPDDEGSDQDGAGLRNEAHESSPTQRTDSESADVERSEVRDDQDNVSDHESTDESSVSVEYDGNEQVSEQDDSGEEETANEESENDDGGDESAELKLDNQELTSNQNTVVDLVKELDEPENENDEKIHESDIDANEDEIMKENSEENREQVSEIVDAINSIASDVCFEKFPGNEKIVEETIDRINSTAAPEDANTNLNNCDILNNIALRQTDQAESVHEQQPEVEEHLPQSLIDELVADVINRVGYLHIEALHRLAMTSDRLHNAVSDALGAEGLRLLYTNLYSKNSMVRDVSKALLEDLLCQGFASSKNRLLAINEFDSPSMLIEPNICIFHIPVEFRKQFLDATVVSGTLDEESYQKYLQELFDGVGKEPLQDRFVSFPDESQQSRALGFKVSRAEKIAHVNKNISWVQATRLQKICVRFWDLANDEGYLEFSVFKNDPAINMLLGKWATIDGMTTETLTWEDVRVYFFSRISAMREPSLSEVQEIEILNRKAMIRSRKTQVRMVAIQAHRMCIQVIDLASGWVFQAEHAIGTHVLQLSQSQLEQICRSLWISDSDLSSLMDISIDDIEYEIELHSLQARIPRQILFSNSTQSEVSLYWIGYDGSLDFMYQLTPGEKRVVDSWVSHVWVAQNSQGRWLTLNREKWYCVSDNDTDGIPEVTVCGPEMERLQQQLEYLARQGSLALSQLQNCSSVSRTRILDKSFLPISHTLEVQAITCVNFDHDETTTSSDSEMTMEFFVLPNSRSDKQASGQIALLPKHNEKASWEMSSSSSLVVRAGQASTLQVNVYRNGQVHAIAVMPILTLKVGVSKMKATVVNVTSLFGVHRSIGSLMVSYDLQPYENPVFDAGKICLHQVEGFEAKITRPKKSQHPGPVECLRECMSEVAGLWNARRRDVALEHLLEHTQLVLPEIGYEDKKYRAEMIKAIQYAKVKRNEESTLRLWNACEKFLRKHQEDQDDSGGGKIAKRQIVETLVTMNRTEHEQACAKYAKDLYETYEAEEEKRAKHQEQQVKALNEIRHKRYAEAEAKRRETERKREEEDKAEAERYRETQALFELEARKKAARQRKQDRERHREFCKRQELDKIKQKDRLLQQRKEDEELYARRLEEAERRAARVKKKQSNEHVLWEDSVEILNHFSVDDSISMKLQSSLVMKKTKKKQRAPTIQVQQNVSDVGNEKFKWPPIT